MADFPITWERRFATSAISIGDLGAVGDGVTDDSPAFRSAIARIPQLTNPWGDARRAGAGVIYVPIPKVAYHFATPVVLPGNKRIDLVGPGKFSVRITAVGDVAFLFDTSAGVFDSFALHGFLFDTCGVQIAAQSRNWHLIEGCFFKGSAVGIDLLDDGGEGGQVGGEIANCEFTDCTVPWRITGQNADNWVVRSVQVTRPAAPVEVRSSGWTFTDVWFEQHTGADNQPWLQLAGNVSNFKAHRVHFRGDNGGGDHPRDAIVLGEIDTVGTGHLGNIEFVDCTLQGRNGGPVAGSGESGIRFNIGVNDFRFKGGSAQNLDHLFRFEHGNGNGNAGGERNYVQVPHSYEVPLSSKPMMRGRAGAWQIDDGAPAMAMGASLLTSTDLLDASWVESGNLDVAQDVDGPDGVTNSAYTSTKTATGSCTIVTNPSAQSANTPAWFRVWLKRPTGSNIEFAQLGWFADYGWGPPIRLTDSWEPYDLWIQNAAAASLWILIDTIAGAVTGTVHVSAPEFTHGRGAR